jgi:hypothetical protein
LHTLYPLTHELFLKTRRHSNTPNKTLDIAGQLGHDTRLHVVVKHAHKQTLAKIFHKLPKPEICWHHQSVREIETSQVHLDVFAGHPIGPERECCQKSEQVFVWKAR